MVKTFSVSTNNRTEMVDITSNVQEIIQESKQQEGLCIIFIPHTTAAVTINENADPSVHKDILTELNKIVPFDDNYSHTEGNSSAHIKSSMIGSSINVIIEDGKLKLGTWQGIYFCEFDGPRTRKVWVKII
ncbi:MAG: secondary thiamine-phosphate synthase enzyme YjbQ [Candidatus Caldatribacteriota bacterium]|jgi:secondary thiamine-phosphate synthase enzyme|nr:secondary thiamine-phosphate synthase enzyme YjbQ [Atribacterota bacterium]MDD3031449.1 secondary thiamine-phosphate synthase enzyme YjbQ [Atribacterota bacterium]MDD4289366.1 secondary thiamine-phosphate synthase enzyme YjbQ [Atribacterota bacterium]MDD4764787.1 secondary thiamine-phosphate synthase enzyme YjbQ [Atribacterota bacterium]MDD5635609.1 secondary thiamine-phosphate synthase enzyme YjbQ [Atribacterota bacterium]